MAGCEVTNSINKALRACGACTAVGAQRDIVLAERLEQSRAFPGNQVTLKLGIPLVDAQGRIAHVRGVIFSGLVRMTSLAVSDPVSAFNLRKLLRQIKISDLTGWQFCQGIDARTLSDDSFFRHWARMEGLFSGRQHSGVQGLLAPAITADAGVPINANVTGNYDVSMYYPFVTLGPAANPLEGLVTLSSLQLATDGGIQMTFGVTGDLAQAPVGQTVVDYRRRDGSVGFDVWLDIVYMPVVVADEAWQVQHYQETELTTDLQWGDRRTELLVLRYLPEDAALLAGQALAQQNAGLSMTVGGNNVLKGITNLDAQIRGELFYATSRDSASVRDNAAQDLPLVDIAGGGVPQAIVILPFAPREASAAGTINFGAQARTPAFWRLLHRTVRCPGAAGAAARAAAIYQAAECGPCGAIFGSTMYGEAIDARVARPSNMRPLIMQPSKFLSKAA